MDQEFVELMQATAGLAIFIGGPAALLSGLARRIGNDDRCSACGYDLRGLGVFTPCPECNGQHRGWIAPWWRSSGWCYDTRTVSECCLWMGLSAAVAVLAPAVLSMLWPILYRLEGWPPHVIENYGSAEVFSGWVCGRLAPAYIGGGILGTIIIAGAAPSRLRFLWAAAALAAVAAAHITITLYGWCAGAIRWSEAAGRDGWLVVSLVTIVTGVVLAAHAPAHRTRRCVP